MIKPCPPYLAWYAAHTSPPASRTRSFIKLVVSSNLITSHLRLWISATALSTARFSLFSAMKTQIEAVSHSSNSLLNFDGLALTIILWISIFSLDNVVGGERDSPIHRPCYAIISLYKRTGKFRTSRVRLVVGLGSFLRNKLWRLQVNQGSGHILDIGYTELSIFVFLDLLETTPYYANHVYISSVPFNAA